MEHKLGRVPALALTFLAAAAAYLLRLRQLRVNLDPWGKYVIGTGKGPLTWLCIAMVLVFAAYAWLLRPRKKATALNCRSIGVMLCTLAAAAGLVLGAAASVLDMANEYDLLLAAGALVTAICWTVVALERFRGRALSPVLFMVPALFYAVRLLLDFRNWSRDPMILDYCFDLLVLICIMCANFHLGGFGFDRGRRRITVFFCFGGLLFGAVAVAGGRMRELASTGGAMLWMAANLWVLLRPGRKRREPASEQEKQA